MIKLLFNLLELLRTAAPLLTSLAVFTLLSVLLAKTIKRRAVLCYVISAIPFLLVAVPMIGRWLGVETSGFTRVPLLGEILRDYIHMGTFGHPLLIIIMYMGALDPARPSVRKLMSIRKELSIIAGFPVLTHSLVRVSNNFPDALKFFTNNGEYMAEANAASELGAGISSFSFVLGVAILALFLPLWITSFDAVHRRMGNAKWKKLQKWAYVFYAMLFIHAMGIQVGGMLNPKGGGGQRPVAEKAAEKGGGKVDLRVGTGVEIPARDSVQAVHDGGVSGERAAVSAPAGRTPVKGIADIKVDAPTRRYIHIASLLLIYGSYLYLRLRKSRRHKQKLQKIRKNLEEPNCLP